MSILDDMNKSRKPVEYKTLSLEDLKKKMGEIFYTPRQPHQPVTIYTGLYGMYAFDYAFATVSGILKPHMTKKHARFVYLDGMGLHNAVDENGIRWMIGKVKDKGYYFTNMEQRMPKSRPVTRRFVYWETAVKNGVSPSYVRFVIAGDSYGHFLDKHLEKKEAKRTGIRRKGTLSPEEGAWRRGY